MNKAARPIGKGTSTKARQKRRQHLQGQATGGTGDSWDDSWDGGWDDWDDGWDANSHGYQSWSSGSGWWESPWERDWSASTWEERKEEEDPSNREQSVDPGRVRLQSVAPDQDMPQSGYPSNRAKKRNKKKGRDVRDVSSSPSPGGWQRDKELGLPMSSVEETDEEDADGATSSASSSTTLEKGRKRKQQRKRDSSVHSRVSTANTEWKKKMWVPKKELEDRKKLLEQWHQKQEQVPLHKQGTDPSNREGSKDADPSNREGSKEADPSNREGSKAADPSNREGSKASGSGEATGANPSNRDSATDPTPSNRADLKRVMVDYHNTLATGNHKILPCNEAALLKLMETHQVMICSWCGSTRAEEVKQNLQKHPWFDRVWRFRTTDERQGPGSKSSIAKAYGIRVMFDDSRDLLEDALAKGIQVYPIKSRKESHLWWQGPKGPWDTFADAVEDYLQSQKP